MSPCDLVNRRLWSVFRSCGIEIRSKVILGAYPCRRTGGHFAEICARPIFRCSSRPYQENHFMRFASVFARALASLMAAMTAALWSDVACTQALDKVSFGTNWVAEAE